MSGLITLTDQVPGGAGNQMKAVVPVWGNKY